VFPVRYAQNSDIKQILFVFKGSMIGYSGCTTINFHTHSCDIMLILHECLTFTTRL